MTTTNIAVQAWVFNPELRNMVVSISGNDSEGDRVNVKGLVIEVKGEELEVRNIYDPEKTYEFHLYEFAEEHGLKLEAWNASPTAYEIPEEYLIQWDGEED